MCGLIIMARPANGTADQYTFIFSDTFTQIIGVTFEIGSDTLKFTLEPRKLTLYIYIYIYVYICIQLIQIRLTSTIVKWQMCNMHEHKK